MKKKRLSTTVPLDSVALRAAIPAIARAKVAVADALEVLRAREDAVRRAQAALASEVEALARVRGVYLDGTMGRWTFDVETLRLRRDV